MTNHFRYLLISLLQFYNKLVHFARHECYQTVSAQTLSLALPTEFTWMLAGHDALASASRSSIYIIIIVCIQHEAILAD